MIEDYISGDAMRDEDRQEIPNGIENVKTDVVHTVTAGVHSVDIAPTVSIPQM